MIRANPRVFSWSITVGGSDANRKSIAFDLKPREEHASRVTENTSLDATNRHCSKYDTVSGIRSTIVFVMHPCILIIANQLFANLSME